MGAKMEALGASIEAYQQNSAEQARQEADRVRVQKADREMNDAVNEILFNPETGVYNIHGEGVIDLQSRVSDSLKKARSTIRNGDGTTARRPLANDEQRAAFDSLVESRISEANGRVLQHVSTEMQRLHDSESDSYIQSSTKSAQLYADDPKRVAAELGRQEAVTMDRIKRNGIGPEEAKRLLDATRSNTLAVVINENLNRGDTDKAQAYFDRFGDSIDGPARGQIEQSLKVGNLRGRSQNVSDLILDGHTAGMIEPPNIDLDNRPTVQNADGSISTIRSITIEEDGRQVLIPTVSKEGTILSNDDAIALYRKTGDHLGKFATPEAAEEYAQLLHNRQARYVDGDADSGNELTENEAMAQIKKIQDPELRDAVQQRVMGEMGRLKQISSDERAQKNATHKAAVEQAYANATDRVTATHLLSAISPTDWALMTPEMQKSTTAYAKTISEGKKVETDLNVFLPLLKMAGNPDSQTEFAKIDFNGRKYLNTVSEAHRIQLTEMQAAILKGNKDEINKAVHPLRSMDQMVDSVLIAKGYDPNSKDPDVRAKINSLWTRLDAAATEKKRETKRDFLTSGEQQEIVDRIQIQDGESHWFKADVPAVFELTPTSSPVSPADRTRAIQILRDRGLDITERNIQGVITGQTGGATGGF